MNGSRSYFSNNGDHFCKIEFKKGSLHYICYYNTMYFHEEYMNL